MTLAIGNPADLFMEDRINDLNSLPYLERRIEIARKITPKPNRFLYKYKAIDPNSDRSEDQIRDILVRSRLWLSSPADFNDPFDIFPTVAVNATGHEIHKRFKAIFDQRSAKRRQKKQMLNNVAKMSKKDHEELAEPIIRRGLDKIGVFSFAGDPRNIQMWSHYAGNHSGICLQFELAGDFQTLICAKNVEYSSKYPELDWINNLKESLRKVVYQKHEGWSYEMEQRIVFPGKARTYVGFNSQALVGIIFGCRISTDIRAKIAKLIEERQNAQMPLIRQYFAQQHNSRYKLLINSKR